MYPNDWTPVGADRVTDTTWAVAPGTTAEAKVVSYWPKQVGKLGAANGAASACASAVVPMVRVTEDMWMPGSDPLWKVCDVAGSGTAEQRSNGADGLVDARRQCLVGRQHRGGGCRQWLRRQSAHRGIGPPGGQVGEAQIDRLGQLVGHRFARRGRGGRRGGGAVVLLDQEVGDAGDGHEEHRDQHSDQQGTPAFRSRSSRRQLRGGLARKCAPGCPEQ